MFHVLLEGKRGLAVVTQQWTSMDDRCHVTPKSYRWDAQDAHQAIGKGLKTVPT